MLEIGNEDIDLITCKLHLVVVNFSSLRTLHGDYFIAYEGREQMDIMLDK